MPSPNATPTPITPPRVPLIDPRTGLIDRAWYLFFLSLNDAATAVIDDSGLTFSAESTIASLEASLDAVRQELQTLPPAVDYTEDILKLRREHNIQPPSEVGELQQQINTLRQEVQTQRQPELGSMAPLQQDNLPWVAFDTTPQSVPDTVTGTLYWDDDDRSKTLAVVMEDTGQIVQYIGEETFYRVKATAAITKGQVIMFTGTVGASGGLLAAPATGLTVTQSEYILGVATQDIALNAWGYATWFGEIKGVNTTGGVEAWVDGQILYYNPSVTGGLTKTVPAAPNVKVIVAAVVNAATNGILFVRPTFGSSLGDNSNNVEITGLANGDLLQYDSAQMRWENVTPASVINSSGGAPVTKTANFSVAAGETWLINNKSGSSCTVTLPTPSTNTGRVLHFQNYQAQTLASASSNVVPLAGGSATTAILEAVAGANATLVYDGTSWIMTQYSSNNSLQLE
jgi:HAMP domain-containing protein